MCIDPQQQALNWIKKKEESNNLKVKNKNKKSNFNVIYVSLLLKSPSMTASDRFSQLEHFESGHIAGAW